MGFPWGFHGIPIGFLWGFFAISIGFLLDSAGIAMGSYGAHGISKGKSVESKLKSVEICFHLIS